MALPFADDMPDFGAHPDRVANPAVRIVLQVNVGLLFTVPGIVPNAAKRGQGVIRERAKYFVGGKIVPLVVARTEFVRYCGLGRNIMRSRVAVRSWFVVVRRSDNFDEKSKPRLSARQNGNVFSIESDSAWLCGHVCVYEREDAAKREYERVCGIDGEGSLQALVFVRALTKRGAASSAIGLGGEVIATYYTSPLREVTTTGYYAPTDQ